MNNELIANIDEAQKRGCPVKSIRKQKHDPSNFYMTCSDGKQLGPIKCEGDQATLDRKYNEAHEHLKTHTLKPRKAA